MANLDRIVTVDISLNTTGVSKEGFSTIAIIGAHNAGVTRVMTYTSTDSMIEDGFADDDPCVLAASAAFSQTPRPKNVKVGRIVPQGFTVTVAELKAGATYTVMLTDGSTNETFSFTDTEGTEAGIITGLAEAMADATLATAEASGINLNITAADGVEIAVQVDDRLKLAVISQESISDAMAAIVKEDNDFYGIVLTSRAQGDILAMAAWCEQHRKIFVTAIAEAGAASNSSTVDTGYQLMDKNYYRTAWYYHELADTEYVDAAIMARCFSINPGGETWANKKLAGITTDKLTETEYNAITKKNGNTFEKFRNVSITQNGKVAAGEWLDVIRFRDWLQEEMTVNIFNLMINRDKIPYTDAGIAMIEAQMRAALDLGVARGGIAPLEYDSDGNENKSYVITVPLAADISANTKALRTLEDISFTARLAGAIHAVTIQGSLTYENLIEEEG